MSHSTNNQSCGGRPPEIDATDGALLALKNRWASASDLTGILNRSLSFCDRSGSAKDLA